MSQTNRYRNVRRSATLEQRRRYKARAERIDREEANSIKAQAKRAKARAEMLRGVLHELKAEREKLGLSLADVSARTGLDKAALSRLENAANANPKLDTLVRYAQALGVELRIDVKRDNAA